MKCKYIVIWSVSNTVKNVIIFLSASFGRVAKFSLASTKAKAKPRRFYRSEWLEKHLKLSSSAHPTKTDLSNATTIGKSINEKTKEKENSNREPDRQLHKVLLILNHLVNFKYF